MIETIVVVAAVGVLLGGCAGWLARGRRCRIAHAHLVASHEPGDLETFLGPEPESSSSEPSADSLGSPGDPPAGPGVRPGRFPGSVLAGPDGAAPDPAYVVKGKVRSRIYRTPDSASYTTTLADVWFRCAEDAEAAGFRRPRRSGGTMPVPHEGSHEAE